MSQEKSDYYKLQTELHRMYHRRRNFIVFLLVGIIFGILAFIDGARKNLPIINIIIIALFVVFIVFLAFMLLNLAWINMNQSDYEEKMVKEGIEYLSKMKLSKKRLEIMGKRAEIGSGAFSSRTILPLTAIPFLIAYFSGKVSSEIQSFILVVLILLGMSFILELDRANMDVLIRQIYVSYTPARNKKKVIEK